MKDGKDGKEKGGSYAIHARVKRKKTVPDDDEPTAVTSMYADANEKLRDSKVKAEALQHKLDWALQTLTPSEELTKEELAAIAQELTPTTKTR